MASRKTIELSFADNKVNCTANDKEIIKKPVDDSFKEINFGGLIVGIKKSTTTNQPEVSDKSLPKKQNPLEFAPKTTNLQSVQVKPKAPVVVAKAEEADIRPLLPRNEVQTKDEKVIVEVPQVTEEDWEIFKQFLDPLPKRPPVNEFTDKNNNLVKNREDFVCSICERFITRRQGVQLKACLHNFCRECLIDEIVHNHDAMGQVKCPFVVEKCAAFIGDEEVKVLLGDSYNQFALKIMQTLHNAIDTKQQKDEAAAILKKDDLDFIENAEEFECIICYTEVKVGDGVTLKNCLHQFCKECIVETVKQCETVEAKCPFMGGDGKSCESTMQQREIRGLVPEKLFNKYLENSLKLFQATTENVYHCKTPDCEAFIVVDKNVRGFMCWLCKKVNCLSCKVIHHGKNCQEYQEEVNPNAKHVRENAESENAIKDMVKNGEAMFCPRCGIPVMKLIGCDYITCLTCKLGICWVTRKPRKPLTKEDGTVIDGCHCRENGDYQRCHPQCNFCH